MIQIPDAAKELRLVYLKDNYQQIIQEHTSRGLSIEESLEELLTVEVYQRRIKDVNFSHKKYLMDFDDSVFTEEIRRQLRELKSLAFIESKENAIFIGNLGTGKTHYSIGLGMAACQQGYKVQFVSAPNLIIQIREAVSESQFYRLKQRLNKVDLLIVDELGYLSFDAAGAELMFNLLSNRIGKGSTIITTNLTFDRWQECFIDSALTGALVDRIAYKAHVIDMRGESYRMKETSLWKSTNNH